MKILAIGSHPDDIELGCGGTIAKHVRNGDEVDILILSRGRITDLKQVEDASMILGVKHHFISHFHAQEFEIVPQADLAEAIAVHIKNLHTDIVYTHTPNDLNKDHKVTYEATMVAVRANIEHAPSQVYCYEVMGSNLQYNQGSKFAPTHYVDINDTVDDKIQAMRCYLDEINEYPQPRSVGGILIHAEFRGLESGLKYAEAFETVRTIG